jgi:hypothetical protein
LPSEPIEQTREEWLREHRKQMAEQEKAITEQARIYNDYHAGVKGLTGEARKAALAAYRKRLGTQPRVVDSEPRLWASKILSNAGHGEVISPLVLAMAKEALNLKEENNV